MPNRENAIQEIMEIFIIDTNQNMLNMETAILDKNIDQVKEISHKIGPMFKLIDALEISNLLDKFENEDLTLKVMKTNFKKLNIKIKELLALIKQEMF